MGEMMITYDAGKKAFLAYETYHRKEELKRVGGWKFSPAQGALRAHWWTKKVVSVAPFAVYCDEAACEAAGIQPVAANANAPAAASGFAPTEEQLEIDRAATRLRDGEVSVVKVFAAAGAGKTSTLKYVAASAYKGMPVYYAVFAKANAEEAKEKMPRNVTSSTLHSAAYRAFGLQITGDSQPMAHFIRKFLEAEVVGWKWLSESKAGNRKSKQQAVLVKHVIEKFCASDDQEIGRVHVEQVLNEIIGRSVSSLRKSETIKPDVIAKRVNKLLETRDALAPMMLRAALAVWGALAHDKQLYHDVYLKCFELNDDLVCKFFAPFAVVFVDEAQDTNPVSASILRKSGKPLLLVGDSYQQMYAFRGAVDTLDKTEGEAVYLSQSFRFGSAIADVANSILRTHPNGGPKMPVRGTDRVVSDVVVLGSSDDDYELPPVTPGQPFAVLCRSNVGVLAEAIALTRAGHRVHIVGGLRESVDELRHATALFEGRTKDIPEHHALAKFGSWAEFVDASVGDEAAEKLIEAVKSGLLKDLINLEKLHDKQPGKETAAVIATSHKAKGLEWDSVMLGDDWATTYGMNKKYNKACEAEAAGAVGEVRQAIESWHCYYVAVTRAKKRLYVPFRQRDIAPASAAERASRAWWRDR